MYIPVVYGVLDSDLVRAGHVVEQIKDSEIARVAMEHLGSMPSYALIPQTDDYTAIIKQCRAFRTPFDEWCLRGFSGSLLRIGGENMAIDRGANFCLSSEMTKQEQKFCFEAILGQDILKSSNEKTERFCRGVMKKYNINPCTGE